MKLSRGEHARRGTCCRSQEVFPNMNACNERVGPWERLQTNVMPSTISVILMLGQEEILKQRCRGSPGGMLKIFEEERKIPKGFVDLPVACRSLEKWEMGNYVWVGLTPLECVAMEMGKRLHSSQLRKIVHQLAAAHMKTQGKKNRPRAGRPRALSLTIVTLLKWVSTIPDRSHMQDG